MKDRELLEKYQLLDRSIQLVDLNGKIWCGRLVDFTSVIDNETDEEKGKLSITLLVESRHYEFYVDEIQSIDVVD